MLVGSGGGGDGGGVSSLMGSGVGTGVGDFSRVAARRRLLERCSTRAEALGGSFRFLSMATGGISEI